MMKAFLHISFESRISVLKAKIHDQITKLKVSP
jgi:hypothetical protein